MRRKNVRIEKYSTFQEVIQWVSRYWLLHDIEYTIYKKNYFELSASIPLTLIIFGTNFKGF